MVKKLSILLFSLFILQTGGAGAADLQSIQAGDVAVFFPASLKPAAKEVLYLYPEIKANMEAVFKWKLKGRPSVLLIKTRESFIKMIGNPLVVAYAAPERNLIVIDYSKMLKHPFSLGTTLKHELSHLLLHQYIDKKNFPRWLDEGLCQWASDGIGEVIMDPKRSFLNRASLSGKFLPLRHLETKFPHDRERLLLAYEESKSFVIYLVGQFGTKGIHRFLNQMRNGETAETAVQKAFSTPFDLLERKWHHSLKKKMPWFTLLSYNLYEILFTLMAIITVFAFIRFRFKKRDYKDDDDLDD